MNCEKLSWYPIQLLRFHSGILEGIEMCSLAVRKEYPSEHEVLIVITAAWKWQVVHASTQLTRNLEKPRTCACLYNSSMTSFFSQRAEKMLDTIMLIEEWGLSLDIGGHYLVFNHFGKYFIHPDWKRTSSSILWDFLPVEKATYFFLTVLLTHLCSLGNWTNETSIFLLIYSLFLS